MCKAVAHCISGLESLTAVNVMNVNSILTHASDVFDCHLFLHRFRMLQYTVSVPQSL